MSMFSGFFACCNGNDRKSIRQNLVQESRQHFEELNESDVGGSVFKEDG